ncbi:MAG: O-antigen ligase family protein [Clostridia bacterium]|nr:O-antigen ligase family protein [Clostridia bacterium]
MRIRNWFKTDTAQKVLLVCILGNIFYLLLASFLEINRIITLKSLSIGMIILEVINITIGGIVSYKEKHEKVAVYLCIALILVCGIIATLFAIVPSVSLFGLNGRYEGLFSVIYYFSLMYLSSLLNKKYKRIVIQAIIVVGIIQCIYAIFQANEASFVRKRYHIIDYGSKVDMIQGNVKKELWVTGFFTNFNFYGTFILICVSYVVGLFIDEEKRNKKIIYAIIFALLFSGLLMSNSTSCAVGFIFVSLYSLVFCIKNKKIKEIIVIALLTIISTTIVYGQNKTTLLGDLDRTRKEVTEMAKGNIDEKYGTKRIYIWKHTLEIVPQYLIHGAGLDNFYFAFDGEPLRSPSGRTIYDKAHNEYLQIIVTEGLLSLMVYLVMYGIITWNGMKNSFADKKIYLILPIIGYLVQAFFNIRDIEAAPFFFIAMGLAIINKTEKHEKREDENG